MRGGVRVHGELVLEENPIGEVTGRVGSGAGARWFCLRILLRVILTWAILMLSSYQVYLVNERQILSHPVEAFAHQIGMAAQTVTVGVTVELANVGSFTDLKPHLMRAGRLMGVPAGTGAFDARTDSDGYTLTWRAVDRKGRQNTITGSIDENGIGRLSIETTDWGPDAKLKGNSTNVLLTAGRFGAVKSSRVQVEGIVDRESDTCWENWVQAWRLIDLQVSEANSVVRVQGVTPDLAQGRRKPVCFTLSLTPDGGTKGRLRLSVETL